MTRTLRCEECGDRFALSALRVDGELEDPDRVVCPDCATVGDRFV